MAIQILTVYLTEISNLGLTSLAISLVAGPSTSQAPQPGPSSTAAPTASDLNRSMRRQPSASNAGQNVRPVRAAAAAAASTFAIAANAANQV